MSGGEIDDGGRNEKRRDAAGTFFEQRLVLALDDFKSTDAAADVDADALGDIGRDFQSGLFQGKFSGGDSELDETADLFDFLAFEVKVGIEVFDFAGDLATEAGGIELLNAGNSGTAFANRLPSRLGTDSERAHQADSGYNYSTRQRWFHPFYFFFLFSM